MPGSKDFFVFQPGGFGDVVLTGQLIGSLKRSYPDRRVILGIDSSFQALPQLFPIAPDEVFTLNVSPYVATSPTYDHYNALRAIRARLASCRVGTFVAAAHQVRWFSLFVAAASGAERVIAAPSNSSADRQALQIVLSDLGLAEPALSDPGLPANMKESERYRALADFISGSSLPCQKWSASAVSETAAREWLRARNIPAGQYILTFPFGGSSVPIKRWPVQRFVSVLSHVAAGEGLRVIFAGTRAEESDLQAAAARVDPPAEVFAGSPRDLVLLSGLISLAKGFLGNDSGLTHLAQALNIPGVAIFGGGHWPAYGPWAPGATGVFHSLPCFRCDWDCLFEQAVCVDRIPETVVAEELRATLHSPLQDPRVVDTSQLDETTEDLILRANGRYRNVARDYHEMGAELLRLHAEAQRRAQALERVHEELASVRQEADRRASALEEMHRELLSVSAEADVRARALEDMSRELVAVRGTTLRGLFARFRIIGS